MASTIAAITTSGGGVVTTADSSGNLSLLSGATTVVAVTATGATVTGTLAATGAVSGTTGTFTSTLGVTGAITGSSTVAGSTGILYPLTSGTAVATTSGTSIDFTGIPSWVKRVTVMFNSVSTNGVYQYLIQLGSGSILTTGYSSTGASIANTTPYADTNTSGFQLGGSNGDVTWVKSGSATFATVGSNIWQGTSCLSVPVAELAEYGAGIVTLGGTLDRIRITTVIGTETFDAGSINILYE